MEETLNSYFFLDPVRLYDTLASLNVFALIALALFPILAYVRTFLATTDSITGKGVGSAYRDFFVSAKFFILYTFLGAFLFGLMPTLREGFALFGGIDGIHANFLKLWDSIQDNQPPPQPPLSFFAKLSLKGAITTFGEFLGTSAGYLLYHFVSALYRFTLNFMEVLLAIYIIVQYAMGFLAIASKAGGRLLDISDAWFKSMYFVFLYIFMETIFMYLIKVLSDHSVSTTLAHFNDDRLASWSVWYTYASVYMVLILIGKVMAAMMANSYANGYSAGNALVNGYTFSTAIGSFFAKKSAQGLKQLPGALPRRDGQRRRDNWARSMAARLRGDT